VFKTWKKLTIPLTLLAQQKQTPLNIKLANNTGKKSRKGEETSDSVEWGIPLSYFCLGFPPRRLGREKRRSFDLILCSAKFGMICVGIFPESGLFSGQCPGQVSQNLSPPVNKPLLKLPLTTHFPKRGVKNLVSGQFWSNKIWLSRPSFFFNECFIS
jgi:hypothetical protein